jgi:aspartate aminotransferase-like enzyme
LALWAANESTPFTHSSNLVAALDVAMAEVERLPAGRCGDGSLAAWFRAELRAAGFGLVAAEPHASPIIVSIQVPQTARSLEIGAALEKSGFVTSYRSGYLAARNWIQVCLMVPVERKVLTELIARLGELAGVGAFGAAAAG